MSSFQEQYEDYLAHYGVKGMRWGVRRYLDSRKERRAQRKERRKLRKSIRGMSNKELQDHLTRIQNEKKLRDLIDEDTQPGRTAVKRALATTGKVVLGAALTGVAMHLVKTAFDNVSKVPVQGPTRSGAPMKSRYVFDSKGFKKNLNIPSAIAKSMVQKKK